MQSTGDGSVATFPHLGSVREKLRFLLNYAVDAPSPCGCVASQFEVTDSGVNVRALEKHGSREISHQESAIHCGAVAYRLATAMRCYEILPRIIYFPQPTDASLIAAVRGAGVCSPTAEDLANFEQIASVPRIDKVDSYSATGEALERARRAADAFGCRVVNVPASILSIVSPSATGSENEAVWACLLTASDEIGSWVRVGEALSQLSMLLGRLGLRSLVESTNLANPETRRSVASALGGNGYAQALLRIEPNLAPYVQAGARLDHVLEEKQAWPPATAREDSHQRTRNRRIFVASSSRRDP